MAMYFVDIDRDKLVAAAGGDPWQVNDSVQCGRPQDVDLLRQVFFSAERSTADAEFAFSQARKRFGTGWDVESSEHPINGSSSAKLALDSLGIQATELILIAADLEAVAAALTAAQRDCAYCISTLERHLARTDDKLGDLLDLGSGRWVT